MKYKEIHAVLPAGKYYIGDVTYILQEEILQNVLIQQGQGKEGVYYSDRGVFALAQTVYGDGVFRDDSELYTFLVDGGNIGIVEEKIARPNNELLIDSDSPVTFRCRRRGVMAISFTVDSVPQIIKIDTGAEGRNDGITVSTNDEQTRFLPHFLIYAKSIMPKFDYDMITCTEEVYEEYLDWYEWYQQTFTSIGRQWYDEELHKALYFLFNRADLSTSPFYFFISSSESKFHEWLEWARPHLKEIERICKVTPARFDNFNSNWNI